MKQLQNIPHQPRFGAGYFHFRTIAKQQQGHRQFYLSWEDALWHLLSVHRLEQGSVILVPEFFCWDVVKNMETHGLRSETYPVDAQLQTTSEQLAAAIKKHSPALVVVLHPAGMTNPLLRTQTSWLSALSPETILIEDCVHKILVPSEVRFLRPRHYLIDSLRKVVPVQGTWLYSREKLPSLSLHDRRATWHYRWAVTLWWVFFQACLWLSAVFSQTFLGRWLNQKAEDAMNQGYDVIGDSELPSKGSWPLAQLSRLLDIEGIRARKREQTQWYVAQLSSQELAPVFYSILVEPTDFSELRGYPLGLEVTFATSFSLYAREHGWLVRLELNDSPWSTRHKVLYLPMGPHVTFADQKQVIALCRSFLQNVKREPYDDVFQQKK